MSLFGHFESVTINMFFVLFCAAALAKRHHSKRRSRSEARHILEKQTFQRQAEENDDEQFRDGNGDSGKSSRRRKSHRGDSKKTRSDRSPDSHANRNLDAQSFESSKAKQELTKLETAKAKQEMKKTQTVKETKNTQTVKETKKTEAVKETKKTEAARNKQETRTEPVEADFVDDDAEPPGIEMDLGEGFPMDPLDDPLAVDMHEYR